MSADFESNITSVERIREYIDQVEHEVGRNSILKLKMLVYLNKILSI
jgi:hypothetical protein